MPAANTLTREQREAVLRIYNRQAPETQNKSYMAFRRTVRKGYDCIMVEWCGMWLGIEQDGYTHS